MWSKGICEGYKGVGTDPLLRFHPVLIVYVYKLVRVGIVYKKIIILYCVIGSFLLFMCEEG